MTYKVWIHIEEIDEDADHYEDLPAEVRDAGEFNTLDEARDFANELS